MKKSFTISILTIVLQSSTCFQKKYCENNLKFRMDFTLTPKDTFRVGDTLWVQAIVPDTMFDLNGQRSLYAPNLELATEIILGKLEQDTAHFATHLFHVVPKIGNTRFFSPGALLCLFDKGEKQQQFQVGLVPQKVGIYQFVPNFSFDEANRNVNLSHNECSDIVQIGYRTNQGSCNYTLLKLFSTDALSETQYIKAGIYGFAVIPR